MFSSFPSEVFTSSLGIVILIVVSYEHLDLENVRYLLNFVAESFSQSLETALENETMDRFHGRR